MISGANLLAHAGESLEVHELWSYWRFEPGVVLCLGLAALLYARGGRAVHGTRRADLVAFWTGWLLLAIALISPLHPLGEVLFSAHMVQHEVLMLAAAPLLVLSRPATALLWGMPLSWRRTIGGIGNSRPGQHVWSTLTMPFTACWIHGLVLWIWHVPRFFQWTLTSEFVHTVQHLSFFGSAILFWWSIFHLRGTGNYGSGVLYVFVTAIHTSVLGALLTFAPTVWYRTYEKSSRNWGLTPLEDQQLGGLVMWIPAGVVYIVAGLFLFSLWLRKSETDAQEQGYAKSL